MPPSPRILAFDTSAAHCAAALLIDGRIVAERYEEMARGQAERLVPVLEEVMRDDGAVWEDLDAIGVGTGPGNFTGLRIAVSAARGLSMSLGIPAIGITAFESLFSASGSPAGRALVMLAAPRGQFYQQMFLDGIADGAPSLWNRPDGPTRSRPEVNTLIVPENPEDTGLAASIAYDLVDLPCEAPDAMGIEGFPGTLMAQWTARLAAQRLAAGAAFSPPAPLYIRPADAAPPREAPPVILP